MRYSKAVSPLLFGFLLLLALSVVLSVVSFLPVGVPGNQTLEIIDSDFRVTPQETYRQGLGTFHGDENVTLLIAASGGCPVNFTLLTYGGPRYSNVSSSDINYSFPAGADYYEAVFWANATTSADIHFQVFVEKPAVTYNFAWLGVPTKALFLLSWAALMLIILKPIIDTYSIPAASTEPTPPWKSILGRKNLRRLKIAILLSLVFWIALLAVNVYPMATFENWYTDAARHPYTSILFTKVGFSVFDTPLEKLSSMDTSFYKFVTWSEMPNLYPLGSILLFLPFGVLLEGAVAQVLVFKMEIALLLAVSHICFYLFLKNFWKKELEWSPKEVFLKPFWKQEFSFLLKAVATYLLYIVLVVYSANGQFDAVAFFFSMVAIVMFLEKRDDMFLLFVAVSSTFKYQAGIFLVPLVLVSLTRLLQKTTPSALFRNKAVLAAVGFAAVDLFTAFLSAPFLMAARPELMMNGVNAFSPHAQISWSTQIFAVLLTLFATLTCAVYLLNKSRLLSLFMVFSLLPAFTMPYFQPWYLPFFFVYPLIPQSKRSLQVTLVWLIFIVFVLSFGGLSYNPLAIIDNVRRILKF
jgi:hypothetical protein